MLKELGKVIGIYRYPVKSMAGYSLTNAKLGWHGLVGDRRFVFIRDGVIGTFPWLTAGKLPQLVTYKPLCKDPKQPDLPTHVLTPTGQELEIYGEELRQEISDAYGSPVRMMQFSQGFFDEAHISIISVATINAIEQLTGMKLDIRRFRPNLVVETIDNQPFEEQKWCSSNIHIEDTLLRIYMDDIRCAMVNINPDSGEIDTKILKAIVQANNNCAGSYARVIGTGTISVDSKLYLET